MSRTDDVNPLLDAVDLLTKPRTAVQWLGQHEHEWEPCPGHHDAYGIERCTTVDCDRTQCGMCGVVQGQEPDAEGSEFHREQHPPLLQLLLDGTGITRGSPSSDVKLPIDADALELWGQVHDMIRLWCKQLDASFVADDLIVSVRHWYMAHDNAVRVGKVKDHVDADVTRMVQGWVRMIEKKFEPDEKREWTDPCPAYVPTLNIDGDEIGHRRCGARRVTVKGEERFAIELNWTTKTAECARCHCKWDGDRGLMMLRYETALYNLERAETEEAREKAMADLVNVQAHRDTPTVATA